MARSRRSRASSTPRFDAASSSTTSRLAAPVQMRVHESHSPHGSPATAAASRRSQLSAIARYGAAQRGGYVLLGDQIGELLGAVLASESDHGSQSNAEREARNAEQKWEVLPRDIDPDVPRSDFRVPRCS